MKFEKMSFLKYIKAYSMYSLAVFKADRAHRKTGITYYVLPNEKNKLIRVDNYLLNKYKKEGRINRCVTCKTLLKECFYFTKGGGINGDDISKKVKEMKRKMWIQYAFKKE